MVTKLPSDFDIFSPSTWRKPLCIQTCAMMSWPKAQRVWAISFSWCGKIEIESPAVNVERLAQVRPAHRRALDVPAGASPAPGTVPAGLILPGGLPQHEVTVASLVGRDFDAGTRDHLVGGAAGQAAVIRHRRNVEQHVACCLVGVPRRDQPRDQRDHAVDMLGRARFDRWRRGTQGGDVLGGTLRAVRSVKARIEMPSSAARALILSSTSVMLRT